MSHNNDQAVPLFKTKEKCPVCGMPYATTGLTFCGKAECPTAPGRMNGDEARQDSLSQ